MAGSLKNCNWMSRVFYPLSLPAIWFVYKFGLGIITPYLSGTSRHFVAKTNTRLPQAAVDLPKLNHSFSMGDYLVGVNYHSQAYTLKPGAFLLLVMYVTRTVPLTCAPCLDVYN